MGRATGALEAVALSVRLAADLFPVLAVSTVRAWIRNAWTDADCPLARVPAELQSDAGSAGVGARACCADALLACGPFRHLSPHVRRGRRRAGRTCDPDQVLGR